MYYVKRTFRKDHIEISYALSPIWLATTSLSKLWFPWIAVSSLISDS